VASASAASPASSATPTRVAPPARQIDPDGNDETPAPSIAVPAPAQWTKVGRHWAALQRVCDFATRSGALFMSHATQPLGLGGATLTRYEPGAKTPFSLVFDWSRPGEPEKGGAGGQGFLRIRDIDGRFYVPDADPPYLGLGLGFGVEGYVFVGDAQGRFPRARMPGHLPPKAPSSDAGGAILLPGAIHVLDVIRFRGKRYASTGALVPPKATASQSPGTQFAEVAAPDRWDVAYTYPGAPGESAVRLGFMTRFKDRLYVAISPLYDVDRNDYVVIAPPPDASTISADWAKAVQATESGGSHTLRWYADRGKLYWITIGADGVALRVTEDGERWKRLALPPDAGRPTDILRAGEQLFVMAERALLVLEPGGFREVAVVEGKKSPFVLDDAYCAAPLVAFDGKLYTGDQKRGALWELAAKTP